MNRLRKTNALLTAVIAIVLFMLSAVSISAKAADDAFEKQIAAFPASYKPYLRELHQQYPTWTFIPFETGLDWNTVIDNEHTDHALVSNADAARIFKSLDSDDYIESEDRFIYKDGSFVAASRTAVEYFMDPRNFLDKGGIFQFELLNFSSLYTVSMVEAVLEGSFMDNTKMTYVDAKGKKYTDTKTYGQAIYEAGQKYNINPCFLASKILNEVGSDGSDSVSGTNKTYPGIYNFYNIGATDGAGAVERGLLWAKGGASNSTYYGRPWTTPYKSILGGAQFLAEEYIAAGQYTGYLQRFNVNPDSDYKLYSHQYMSNLTGALSQGYSTYRSYRDMNMLNTNLTFSIPVYKNMSDVSGNGKLAGAESTEQYGSVTSSFRYVRTGPSIDHDIATDASGEELYLERGDEVKILDKIDTDAYYYEEILTWPYWYKVSFTSSGKTYTGYIPGDNIDVKTMVHVTKGRTDIALVKTSTVKSKIASSKPSMVKIIDENTVEFLKNGTVKLYFYDSYGHIEEILFRVGNYASYYTSDLKTTAAATNITASSAPHASAKSYGYALADTSGNLVKKAEFTTAKTRTFDGLKSGTPYVVYAQNCFGKNVYTKAVEKTVITTPDKVATLTFVKTASGGATLNWTAVSKATAYEIYSYNRSTNKYTKVTEVAFGKKSFTLTASQAAADEFVVRAYTKHGDLVSYGALSNMVCISEKPYTPAALKASSVTATGYTLSWTGNKDCDGFEIYYTTPSSETYKLYKQVTATSFKFTGLKSANAIKFKVRSFKNKSYGKLYSDFSEAVVATTLPETVKNLKLTAGSSKVTASWTAVSGAEYYTVTYKKAGGSTKNLKVTGNSCTIQNADSYSTYYVAVSATVKVNSKSVTGARCIAANIKTKPPVPKNLAVTLRGYNHIDLSWKTDSALNLYRVYYLNSAGKALGFKDVKTGSVRISGLSPVTTYKFIIRGYKLVNGKYIASDNSVAITSSTVIPTVTGVKASAVKEKSFRLTWTKVEGAVNYNLYHYRNGAFKKVLAPKTNYCDVTFLSASTKGQFYITAVFKQGTKYVESKASATFTASVLPSALTGLTVKAYSNKADISWKKVNNADFYRVYLKENGKYVLKKTVTTNSCTLTSLKDCTANNVAVRPYFKNTTGNVGGAHASKNFTTTPIEVTSFTQSNVTDTSYTLAWNKSSASVNRYYLYRYNDEAGRFEVIAATAQTSYNVTGLEAGTQQRYAVIATVIANGKVTAKSLHTYTFECGTAPAEAPIYEGEDTLENAVNSAINEVEITTQTDNISANLTASTNSAENLQ